MLSSPQPILCSVPLQHLVLQDGKSTSQEMVRTGLDFNLLSPFLIIPGGVNNTGIIFL